MADLSGTEEIGELLAEQHRHWYGSGPQSVRTIVQEDVVVVLLEGTFNRADQAMIERGETGGLQERRRIFQQSMGQDWSAIVEQATGRHVRSFVSSTDLEENLSIEVFVLGPVLEDMRSFEEAGTTERSDQLDET